MLTSRERLRRQAAQPYLVTFRHALGRLASPLTVMNTGAHPDDEQNGLLATLRHQHGMRVVIACSTRGEGGQNILGPERGGVLGVMRSREMEESARVIDADLAWLGHGPDDPVHDFGFSKSGPDTLSRWGKDRTIERLVRAYRQFRPDIVIPTFLDVPGQHGHHRAMTQAAETALALAADPACFLEHAAEGLKPWRVAKYYLPAWTGGENGYYDDEVPPPPATTTVIARSFDPATGLAYDRLGEISRAYHASQNMGHWIHPAPARWDLHLLAGGLEPDILAELPTRLADLAPHVALGAADAALAEAIASFPDARAAIRALLAARSHIGEAQSALDAKVLDLHDHRLARKLVEIDAAIAAAANIRVYVGLASADVVPGGSVDLMVEVEPGLADTIAVQPIGGAALDPAGPVEVETRANLTLKVRADAQITNAFAPDWSSLGGNGTLWLSVTAALIGETISFSVDTEEQFQVQPPHSLTLAPEALIIPLPAEASHHVAVKPQPDLTQMALEAPQGVEFTAETDGFRLTATPALAPGRHSLPVRIAGRVAHQVTPIAYQHIGRTRFVKPLALDILALDLTLPKSRIGYIGGGSDRVGHWLDRMGANPTMLEADALSGSLAEFDTIVVGIFAFGNRPDLAAAAPRLHHWVEQGGHLVTLYHRPTDGWTPETTPPRRLVIGSPSLRWRVTNPAAPVTVLAPDHKLLAGPNAITQDDFAGWDKERGLYFASDWDKAYQPLLSMHDEGENPLTGSMLSAEIGKGRHTHTSLVLHHQLDRLVPGAFRIMANLLQPA
ncbi:MAG: PIG-L family deacetylase [Devosia sp.]|nr:PIG-L family deacetylase [Devosia sp.]